MFLFAVAALLTSALPAGAPAATAIDVASTAGVYEVTRTWSANVHDFNGDGWPDVLLVRHWEAPARLYRNDRGHFTETNVGTFTQTDRHDCAWGDVNRDGLPDVYCTNGADNVKVGKKNELWLQRSDGTFVERAELYGVADQYGRGRNATFIDVNHDRYPDLFVGNEYPRSDGIPSPNRLFLNVRGVIFRDAVEYGLDREVGGNCAQAADFNRDGWEDLLVCGKTSLKLYRNEAGTAFTDLSSSVGIGGFWRDALLVDLDGDGWLDLAQVRWPRLEVRLQRGGSFGSLAFSRSLAAGRGIAAGDVNGDSRPDLYVLTGGDATTSNYPDAMLLNNGSGTGFAETAIPQATFGMGDAVAAIDYNRNGKADFIVLNGQGQIRGPVQLISFP